MTPDAGAKKKGGGRYPRSDIPRFDIYVAAVVFFAHLPFHPVSLSLCLSHYPNYVHIPSLPLSPLSPLHVLTHQPANSQAAIPSVSQSNIRYPRHNLTFTTTTTRCSTQFPVSTKHQDQGGVQGTRSVPVCVCGVWSCYTVVEVMTAYSQLVTRLALPDCRSSTRGYRKRRLSRSLPLPAPTLDREGGGVDPAAVAFNDLR